MDKQTIIDLIYRTIYPYFDENYNDFVRKEVAKQVLDNCLKSGMLPPFSPPEKLSVLQDEHKYTQYYKWDDTK
jgi:hypothetical protein